MYIWNFQIIKTLKIHVAKCKKSKNLNGRHNNDKDDHLEEGQQTRMAAHICNPST